MPYSDDGHDVPKHVTGDKKRRQWSHVWNSEYKRQKEKGKSDAEAERIAFASANSVASKAAEKRYEQILQKAIEDDAREFANALIFALEEEWRNVPVEIQPALTTASLSGVGQGMLQIDVSNAALIASANTIAENYARDRAAELVGMKRDAEGNLVENPNAQWAISDTTRERIREIIADAFTEDTPIEQIARDIQAALEEESTGMGIFSMARAELIATTEVSNAQAGGNYSVWRESGIVKKLEWVTAEDEHVCEICEGNDGVVVDIGRPFPSGDLYPGAHPRCRCGIFVKEVSAS